MHKNKTLPPKRARNKRESPRMRALTASLSRIHFWRESLTHKHTKHTTNRTSYLVKLQRQADIFCRRQIRHRSRCVSETATTSVRALSSSGARRLFATACVKPVVVHLYQWHMWRPIVARLYSYQTPTTEQLIQINTYGWNLKSWMQSAHITNQLLLHALKKWKIRFSQMCC